MKVLLTIAKKEYTDATRNALFLTLAAFLLALVGISILVASMDFGSQVAQYRAALAQLTQSERAGAVLATPQYYPLQMLRGTIEYLEIIGAIIAIVLGYLSIAKEKASNTSRLLLTRPVGRLGLVGGKVLGNSALLISLLAIIYLFAIVSVTSIGHIALSGAESLNLMLAMIFSYVYLLFFFCFAAALALLVRDLSRALMLAFSLWLVFVLIIPQVGDTMDPDNQVPGGFFASMHVTQDQQTQIIGNFRRYESLRNALEVSSIEKQYERLTFALLGIKPLYNGKPLGYILRDKWLEMTLLVTFYILGITAAYILATNRRIMISSP